MKIIFKNTILILLFTVVSATVAPVIAKTQTKLSLETFIKQATKNDSAFESILIDQLTLKHRRDILLPDSDLIMDVKYQYNFLSESKFEQARSLNLT